jgi:PilZ domain
VENLFVIGFTDSMALPSSSPLRLLAELLELDQLARDRRATLTLAQKQRRQIICQELRLWFLARQGAPSGGEQRRDPRAAMRVRVQLLGGPRPVDLQTESLAVGGLSVTLHFAPRKGDLLALRLVPAEPDPPLALMGEVVWYDPRRTRAGLRFKDPSEEAKEVLERIVFGELVRGAGVPV